ncbi:hypothetical protein [Shewanella sp. YLB-07]|uniref:hypothetical protein n=1 Tax=Shewanella sp. YLB-07 TaxID=2601268 RepID=UPI00128B9E90|nr:hypothetical protein [Shewanella sp. YLB-07]MPY24542.1 hypothetical protein [Shewanella sp. YLB-07]
MEKVNSLSDKIAIALYIFGFIAGTATMIYCFYNLIAVDSYSGLVFFSYLIFGLLSPILFCVPAMIMMNEDLTGVVGLILAILSLTLIMAFGYYLIAVTNDSVALPAFLEKLISIVGGKYTGMFAGAVFTSIIVYFKMR